LRKIFPKIFPKTFPIAAKTRGARAFSSGNDRMYMAGAICCAAGAAWTATKLKASKPKTRKENFPGIVDMI
jgi:hypothetical protein